MISEGKVGGVLDMDSLPARLKWPIHMVGAVGIRD